MSYFLNNQQKFNEVVFEHRNKAYGAFAIRSAYGQTMLKSISIMMFGIGCIVSTAYYLSLKPNFQKIAPEQIPDIIYSIPVDLKKEIKPEIPKTMQTPLKGSANSSHQTASSLVIIDSLAIDTTKMSETNTPFSANKKPLSGTGNSNDTASTTTGGGSAVSGTTAIKFTYEVDSPPEFEGGLPALYKFVSSRLKYPEIALENGIQGTVFVQFVVDEKGRVVDLSVLNNPGNGFDDEARRVVSMIPNFKTPAKVKGEAVKAFYQLPIKFKCR